MAVRDGVARVEQLAGVEHDVAAVRGRDDDAVAAPGRDAAERVEARAAAREVDARLGEQDREREERVVAVRGQARLAAGRGLVLDAEEVVDLDVPARERSG